MLGSSFQVATMEYHGLDGLNNRHVFLPVLGAGSPRTGCQHIGVLVRALFLSCRRPVSPCVLTWRDRDPLSQVSALKDTNPTHSTLKT